MAFVSLNRMALLGAVLMLTLAGAPRADAQLDLVSSGACPGTITLTVSNATPGGRVGFAYGFNPGQTPVPSCPGVFMDINAARVAGIVVADGNGVATLSGFVPDSLCGRVFIQALDAATCRKSNVEIVGSETLTLVPELLGPGGGGGDGNDYCIYQILQDCPELGIRAGNNICVLCENQSDHARCQRQRSRRVTIRFSRDCEQEICVVLAIGAGGCADCPRNVPPEHRFRYCR